MPAPFESFAIRVGFWVEGSFIVDVEPWKANHLLEAQRLVFIESAIREKLDRIKDAEEGK